MSLSPAVMELLGLIGNDEDRKQLQALAEKYEPLRGAVMRQSDYDRSMNEGKAKIQAAEDESKKWREWSERNVPKHEELLKDYDKATQENSTLKSQVEDLTRKVAAGAGGNGNGNGGGGALDQKQIVADVMKELGGKPVSQKELTDLVVAKVAETASTMRDKFYKEDLPQSLNWQSAMLAAQMDYQTEMGKSMTREKRQEFSKFILDNKIQDPGEGLDRWLAKDREEKRVSAEVDRRVKEEMSKRQMPGVSSAAPADSGPLQTYLGGKAPKIPEGSRPGDGSLAAAAADSLRADGKF